MERGSAKHGARVDDELEREAELVAKANPPIAVDQLPDVEDPGADEPDSVADYDPTAGV